MKNSTKRRIRRLRRLAVARIRTGKSIVTHKSPSGRTGTIAAKRRGSGRVLILSGGMGAPEIPKNAHPRTITVKEKPDGNRHSS